MKIVSMSVLIWGWEPLTITGADIVVVQIIVGVHLQKK